MIKSITNIILDGDSESYYVVYIDDQIYKQGDDYHDKIYEKLNGVIEFLDYFNCEYKYDFFNLTLKTDDKELWEYDYQPKTNETIQDYLKRIKKFMKLVDKQ